MAALCSSRSSLDSSLLRSIHFIRFKEPYAFIHYIRNYALADNVAIISDLLTHISSPQSQFDQYSIIYDSVVFNLQSDIYLLISFDFHYICFNGLRHRHIRYIYRFLSISIIYVAVVCQRYLAVLRHLAIRE